ncbi:hypothetical protein ACH347_00645 [Saccharopolyspora sp. 5N102]
MAQPCERVADYRATVERCPPRSWPPRAPQVPAEYPPQLGYHNSGMTR